MDGEANEEDGEAESEHGECLIMGIRISQGDNSEKREQYDADRRKDHECRREATLETARSSCGIFPDTEADDSKDPYDHLVH